MNKTTRLKVLANYAKLGLAEDKTLYSHLRNWLKYQACLQGILANQDLGGLSPGDNPQRSLDSQCRFFITAHFGIYPIIIAYLAELYPTQKIVCLVGKQQSLQSLILLAERYQLNLEFVEVGASFISLRRCLRLAKSGSIFLSLIDVPLGVSDKTEHVLDFFSGHIRVRAGLLKLAERLGLQPRFIVAGWSEQRVPLTSYEVTDVEQIFSLFAKHVSAEPHLWDKVIDLHRFYRSEVPRDLYLPFRIKRDYFLMELISDKVMRISESLYHKARWLSQPECPPDELDRQRQKIHEQTDLFIRQAV